MTLVQAFVASVSNFKKMLHVVTMPFWKVMLYSLFLAGLLAVPMIVSVANTAATLRADAQTIAKKLPAFSIKDDKLTTADEGQIYLANSLIMTFDPEGKRTEEEIIADTKGNTIAVGLLPDSLILALPANTVTDSFFEAGHFSITYEDADLDDLDNQMLADTLKIRIPVFIYVILFFIALYPIMLNFLINILFITVFAHFYARINRLAFRFSATLKLVIFSSTLSVLAMTLLNLFGVSYNQLLLMVILTMIVFQRALLSLKKTLLPPDE